MKLIAKIMAILMIASACHAQGLVWTKPNGFSRQILPSTPKLSPVQRAHAYRQAFDMLRLNAAKEDTLIASEEVDFGHEHVVPLPNCNYEGTLDKAGNFNAKWITRCRIDGTATKATGPGFSVGSYASFKDFTLIGDCANKAEDGGLIGWDNKAGDGELRFENCLIDGREGMDWVIYTWNTAYNRKIVLDNCTVHYCRFGIAAAGSGAKPQIVEVSNSRFYGNAGGSKSFGASSGPDPVTGGVLAAVLNRRGDTTIKNSHFVARGLTAPYNHRWGCPRIAAIFTNYYSANSGATRTEIDGCTAEIERGITEVWNDLDVRGEAANKNLLVRYNVGSASDGLFKRWQPPTN